jgi:hypothetical protein
MDQTVTDRIEEQLKSAFPAGAIERVQVLEYSDDPEVEPGQTAVRAFIARGGRPEGEEADKETVTAFEEANRPVIMKIRDELPASSGGSSSCLTGQAGRPGLMAPSSGSEAAGDG